MTIEERKEYAFLLFTKEHLHQKVCAQRAGVSEKTMTAWVNADSGRWKTLRSRMLISKDHQLGAMYAQLENLNVAIQKQPGGHPDTKQADILVKLTSAIRNMETDLAIADLVESGIRFMKFLQRIGTIEQTLEVSELWNAFIQDSIRK